METNKENYYSFSEATKILTQEERLETGKQKKQLTIGIPREISYQENRVSLVPDGVGLLVNNGHKVLIETNAGKASNFLDNEYNECGGNIVYNKEEVFQSDIILKVSPPSDEEIDMLKYKQSLISTLHLGIGNVNYLKKLMSKKITAIAFEYIKDKTNTNSVVRSMSEIAGNTSILIAAEYLSNINKGKGLMLGGFSGITPTEVVILGAGTVGEFAARAAMGLGATVKVFDNSIYKLRRLQNSLGTRIITSVIQPRVLLKSLKTADVVIGAMHASQGRTPCIVTEEMVSQMKKGSVIIDVSIDQGGCIETSHVTNHTEPVYVKYGVIHYCVPNITSRVSRTASYALNNFFAPILINIGDEGGIENFIKNDPGFRQGAYLFTGILTNKYIAENYQLPFQDIDLLLAAFH
ncbi:MAG: alanine dehydrogenase [Bacteroidota bacterium]|nr:alanine dehydrogenase [Bacteroidota bacterium]